MKCCLRLKVPMKNFTCWLQATLSATSAQDHHLSFPPPCLLFLFPGTPLLSQKQGPFQSWDQVQPPFPCQLKLYPRETQPINRKFSDNSVLILVITELCNKPLFWLSPPLSPAAPMQSHTSYLLRISAIMSAATMRPLPPTQKQSLERSF